MALFASRGDFIYNTIELMIILPEKSRGYPIKWGKEDTGHHIVCDGMPGS